MLLATANNYIVYKHECKLCTSTNGIYIGITSQELESRWKNGRGYLTKHPNGRYHQPAMANAILKYGWENFTHEILFENLSESEAKQKEKELIAYYDSYTHGLNCTLGGEGCCKYQTSEERIEAKKQTIKKHFEKIYTNTALHEALKAAQKEQQKARKQDPIKHAKDLESCKLANQRRRQDPQVREQINKAAKETYRKKRSSETGVAQLREYGKEYRKQWRENPENRKQSDKCAKAARQKVTDCRKLLKEIYKNTPELFTETDYQNIFGRKVDSGNYQCMTYKVLNEILVRVQGEIE
jgi:hypothetical protein